MRNLNITIITGYSGSGKSTAIAAFEDAGFYCVDNMPVILLPDFLKLSVERADEIAGLAFVMDLREKRFLSEYVSVFESLRKKGYKYETIFLEANEKTLLQRYSQTRRHHPLSRNGSLLESIRAEKEKLKDLRKVADRVIETSYYSAHELKAVVFRIVQTYTKLSPIKINVMSFGFKYGIPNYADLIIDVRFLVNPFFDPKLKILDGEAEETKKYILNNNDTRIFLQKYLDLLDYLIPLYEKEGKAYLTLAVGCTGGRHRSVTIARSIFNHISGQEKQVEISHRDIDQETVD